MTPLELAAEQVHVVNNSAPGATPSQMEHGSYIDPEDLSPDLLYEREKVYCWVMADRFHRWLLLSTATRGIPLDGVLRTIETAALYVEAMLLANCTRGYRPKPVEVEDEPEVIAPRTEADAAYHGLTVKRPRRRQPPANLPGCQGADASGYGCPELRRYGHRFCPTCEAKELQRIRRTE